MQTLLGKHIRLRALEPEDLSFLFETENNEAFWEVSHTQTPFSKFVLKKYLENAHLDIYEAKQLRLIIEENTSKKQVGAIDLFDFNPQHKRAGIGILIHTKHQQNGFASEALQLLIDYCFSYLNLHQLYANITTDIHIDMGINIRICGLVLLLSPCLSMLILSLLILLVCAFVWLSILYN